MQCACSAAADMTCHNPGDPDHSNVSRELITTRSPTVDQKLWALSGSSRTFRKASDTSAFLISILSLGNDFHSVTRSSRNLGSAWAHKHWGTVSASLSLFSPHFFSLLCSANEKSLIIRTSGVTTAANGDTLRFGISCAADSCVTKNF